jgi:hypothetical protein
MLNIATLTLYINDAIVSILGLAAISTKDHFGMMTYMVGRS